MLRLTLLSGRDGRLLGRVVESNGRPFVLDQGESHLLEDLVQRLNHGFTVIRAGQVVHISPDDPNVLAKLAAYYAGKGALVFLEEPNWPGRGSAHSEPFFFEDDRDEPTESLGLVDLPSVDDAMVTISPDEDPSDAPTEPAGRTAPGRLDLTDATGDFGLLPGVPEVDPS